MHQPLVFVYKETFHKIKIRSRFYIFRAGSSFFFANILLIDHFQPWPLQRGGKKRKKERKKEKRKEKIFWNVVCIITISVQQDYSWLSRDFSNSLMMIQVNLRFQMKEKSEKTNPSKTVSTRQMASWLHPSKSYSHFAPTHIKLEKKNNGKEEERPHICRSLFQV